MNKRKVLFLMSLFLAAAVLCMEVGQAVAQSDYQQKRLEALDRLEKAMVERNKIDPKFPPKLPEYQITPVKPLQGGPIGYNWNVNYDLPNWAYSPNIRKFVDTLPGLGIGNANTLGQYIPVAVPDTTTYSGSQYYEIDLNYYVERLHPDLPAPGTKLRGYAQTNMGGTPNRYLGPLILAKSYDPRYPAGDVTTGNGWPVRLKFRNNLPVSGSGLPGELLPFPVDTTLMGAGEGPLGPAGGFYTENRSTIHLHGGATPWISDGTPHQWFTPAADPTSYKQGLSFQNVPDMIIGGTSPCSATTAPGAPCFTPAPGDGLGTYYFTNQQSGRLMFYHDHAYGITRLNVYGGVAAGYLLYDQVEQDLIEGSDKSGVFASIPLTPVAGVIPNPLGGIYEFGIPLVIQDRTFVNDATTPPGALFTGTETAKTTVVDPLWNDYMTLKGVVTTGGDFWIPHEYIPNEDIYKTSGFNPFGRFDYAPWMAPPIPANNINLPSPSHVPEAMMDVMLVNGHPYPYVSLPQGTYRFRILNAGNDRHLNLQLYYAADATGDVCKTGGPAFVAAECTEPKMVSASRHLPVSAGGDLCNDPPTNTDSVTGLPYNILVGDCWPVTWPNDGRVGGVPDPKTAGPKFIQIGSEGGLLPQVAIIPSNPTNFDYSRRSVTVLGVSDKALWLGGAERADVIVDLSQVPLDSYLILYTDAPAPTPLFDPRTDIFVGQDDQTADGGAPAITRGFGPNTRTIMQIRVTAGSTTAFDLARLQTALPKAYAKSQPRPIVPETAYNLAFPGTATVDDYADVTTESFNVTGVPTTVGRIVNAGGGQGYTADPSIIFAGGHPTGCIAPTCTDAQATACRNGVTAITVTLAGSGYIVAPTVNIAAPPPGGTLATAVASIQGGVVTGVFIVNPGCGYLLAPIVTLSAPPAGGVTATAVGAVAPGSVGTITLSSGGSGYIKPPLVYVVSTNGLGTGALADAILTGGVALRGVAITEGFDLAYGRGSVVLGTLPVPLLPLAPIPAVPAAAYYIDPPSDFLDVNEPQYWRISHIGVDSHPLHFHFINVQVVNRVDWTNSILPPDANELGWKETVRTIPFTDLIVAFKAQPIKLPFRLPLSNRLLDPTTIAGSTANFTPILVAPGAPAAAAITNVATNFGHEYVFHCHMLSHEENDMMRPLVVNPFNSKVGTFSASTWNLQKPYPTNSVGYSFGLPGDIAVTGDWTGDGINKIGVFRVSGGLGRFYLDWNGNGIWEGPAIDKVYTFGITGDIPVVGDWTGNGKTKIGVFRVVAGAGKFYLDWNGNGIWEGIVTDKLYTFGITGDKPVAGDWTGNGITKIGISRPSGANRTWLLDWNGNGVWEGGVTDRQYSFGLAADIPVTGDWDGNGITKIGVFRGAGQWLLDKSGNGVWSGPPTDTSLAFGAAGNQPVTGKW